MTIKTCNLKPLKNSSDLSDLNTKVLTLDNIGFWGIESKNVLKSLVSNTNIYIFKAYDKKIND